MDNAKGVFRELSNRFKLQKYGQCLMTLKKLASEEWFESSEDVFRRIHENDRLICEYLEKNRGRKVDENHLDLSMRAFYGLLKGSIFSSSSSDVDLVLASNVLQFCCCSDVVPERSISNFDCFCAVVIAIKKAMCKFSEKEFTPPISLEIGDPCAEVITLFEDIIKSLQICDKMYKPLVYSTLMVLLQTIFVMNGGYFHKSLESECDGWKTKALEKISVKVPWLINFLEKDYPEARLSVEEERTKVKSELAMEVDSELIVYGLENNDKNDNLTSMPIFTYSATGECSTLQDDCNSCAMRSDVKQSLLFTLCVIYEFFSDFSTKKTLNVEQENFSGVCITGAWKYFKGYLSFKTGNIKEALNEIDEANFNKFPTHFKSRKALLAATILLKMGKPMMALTILNKDALECEDCLPNVLLLISEAYECLHYDESLLGVLRQLVKVLRHKNFLKNLHLYQRPLLIKTLDLIHPLPKVNLEIALEKLAYRLCKNELYEESVEYFLDLLALLETNGPAKVFRFHLHNIVAVILLLSETSEVDRTEEAISLCSKAAAISQGISTQMVTPLSDYGEDGPSANKRSKLECDVQNAFRELNADVSSEDQMNLSGNLESCVSLGAKNYEHEDIVEEVHSPSVYASLMFSEHDLLSCILMSECALRGNDFSKSLLLLNRCLQHISHHQVAERVKDTQRNDFLKTTDFILSNLWLRKAKVLIKKELEDGISYRKDIKHCFRNALLRNPDNADIKYNYAAYLMRSDKNERMDVTEIVSLVEGKMQFNSFNNASSFDVAIWYLFRCQITRKELESLRAKVKQLK